MAGRARWIRLAVVVTLAALVVGRWAAVSTADRLWAEVVGVPQTHAHIARLKLMLLATASAVALVWCIGNLFLVYRSVRSVHVPRRLGNIEILEAVPRRYLLLGTVVVGAVLALAISHGAGGWWQARALAGAGSPLGIADPVLHRDVAFYLFALPWQRTLHGFVTFLSGTVLAVSGVLYLAMGAIRWQDRRLQASDNARVHLAGLLVAFAVALYWGYRLEPAEYVAGIHGVPADDVLVSVRLPVARLLAALALVAAGGSLLWLWTRHAAPVMASWIVLGVASFTGHYAIPAFSGSVRPADELPRSEIESARGRFLRLAFRAAPVDTTLRLSGAAEPAALARYAIEIIDGPMWDAFAITVFLDRAARGEEHWRFGPAALTVYPRADGVLEPVYLAVREVDLSASGVDRGALDWEAVHVGPYATAAGAIAVSANRVSETGLPVFIPDLSRPDSVVPQASSVPLTDSTVVFGPAATSFVVLPATDSVAGVRGGGLLRRLALAWVLQSPQLVTSGVGGDAVVAWRRSVTERLEHLAPFAHFAEPYPVVVDGRLHWLSSGYLTAETFPISRDVLWRGERVRYLRAGLVGVVDARTGEAGVYQSPDPDPLGLAWAELAPEVVRPFADMPPAIRAHLRYPEEAFDVQRALVAETLVRGASGVAPLVPGRGPEGSDAFWWVGRTPVDPVRRLRRMASMEDADAASLEGVVDGYVGASGSALTLVRVQAPVTIPGPASLTRRMSQLRPAAVGVDGALRVLPFADGIAALQPTYDAPGTGLSSMPRLRDVGVAWDGVVERGPTVPEALRRLQNTEARPDAATPRWVEARRWFEQLDSARAVGDWNAFGRAYEALRRVLGAGADP
jgi:hypothetical protein